MADVSRETPELSPPPEAVGVLLSPERAELLERYAASLATEGVVRGLIGPREVPRLWERHLLNSVVLGEVVPEGASVADVGSGAGLPGLALAIARPDLTVTLIEPLLRRTTYLSEAVATLDLGGQVRVVRARAEECHGGETYDVVTSRAVAPLERLLRWCMPLVAPTGSMVAIKGEGAADEIAAARKVWVRLGCAEPSVGVVGADVPSSTTSVVTVSWADPRRVGWAGASPTARRGRTDRGSRGARRRTRDRGK